MSKALFVIVGLSMGISACTGGTTNLRQDSTSRTSLASHDIDAAKVATVNRWAIDHGARLIWINYPQRLLAGDDDRGR